MTNKGDKMESGELELRKAFEEVTTNNVKAILEHGNTTRKLVKEMMERIDRLEGQIGALNKRIDSQHQQISFLQARAFSGGTS